MRNHAIHKRPPSEVMEKENVNFFGGVPFQLQKNKIAMAVYDKQTDNWTLLEGTVCQVGTIEDKIVKKQEKYTELRAGIKQLSKSTSVTKINLVFDFLGGYHEELRKRLSSITNTDKELSYLLERCQKWIICQNANVVKMFYEYV